MLDNQKLLNEHKTLLPTKTIGFKELGVSDWLIQTLKKLNVKEPTEIQKECIPQILAGKNVVGGAKTGSGKTAAFALPIIQQLSLDPYGIFALILTPTRELAIQIKEQFKSLGQDMNIKVSTVIGGMEVNQQAGLIAQKPHIVIATPGRLNEIIDYQEVCFKKIKFLVLDESDQLLKDNFAQELAHIFQVCNKERQTLLFTATITENVLEACSSSTKELSVHLCKSKVSTVDTLVQEYIFVPSHVKELYLYYLVTLKDCSNKSRIIFVDSCKNCELLYLMLQAMNINCLQMHSKMKQKERTKSLLQFRNKKSLILITTDVGSRGLDIPINELVINYNVPIDPDIYIHRVGRTARAGRAGKAITIITEKDIQLIHAVEKRISNDQLKKLDKKLKLMSISEKKVLLNASAVAKAKTKAVSTMYAAQLKNSS